MKDWGSADFELAVTPPVGWRHPNNGEYEAILADARTRFSRKPSGAQECSPWFDGLRLQNFHRAVSDLVRRVLRKRKIFIEGM